MKGLAPDQKITDRQIATLHIKGKPTLEFHYDLFKDCFLTYSYLSQRKVNSEITYPLLPPKIYAF